MKDLRLSWLVIAATLLALSCPSLRAQTNQGSVAGTVLDETGATVEGASITLKSEATGVTLSGNSGPGGAFRFPSVAIGLYDISASHPGFSSVTQTGVNVQISTTASVTVTLPVGKAEQTVTVQADVTRIETESSDIGTVITTRQVVELPLALGGVGAMRSPEAFMFLAPGTAGPGTASSNNGIFISKIGGGQSFGNEILLDGTSMLRSENGSSFDEAAPSVEAIAEFKVLTSTIPAIYGRTTGGIETFSTKSGTNQFHGTAYDIVQNEDFNANSWFNNGNAARCASDDAACRAPFARPIDKKNDYGTNLGGPVVIPKLYNGRDKTFFFFNWEQFHQNLGGTSTVRLPTDAERAGDFSDILDTSSVVGTNPCDGSSVFAGEIFDPATTRIGPTGIPCRTSFLAATGKNAIPAGRISQVAKNFLTYVPSPNFSGNGVNYSLSSSNPLDNTTYTVRIDHSMSDKSRLFGMYDTRENSRYTTSAYNLPAPLESTGQTQDFITHFGRAGWDYIFNPTLLNHLSLGWNRTNSKNYSLAANQAAAGNFSWNTILGIGGLNGSDFPQTSVGESIPNFGITRNADYLDDGLRVNDQVTWARGNHSLTMGFDFRNQVFSVLNAEGSSGTFNFSRNETAAATNLNATSGYGFASFLLGTVDNANATIRLHTPRWVSQYYAGFVQDDWKVTPTLTLNLGLRWEVDVPRRESYNNTSNFDPAAPNPAAGGVPGALIFGNTCQDCNPRWADTKYHDLGPRIGFAFNPNRGRIVLRGGYGLIYGALQYTDFGNNMIQGYAATPVFRSLNGFDPAFNWDTGFPSFAAPALDPSIVNGGNPNYIAPRYGQPAIVQSWSFQIEGQVSKDMIATVAYVGQRAQNLRSAIQNINNIPMSAFALGDALNQNATSNTVGVTAPYAGFTGPVWQAIRPYPQYDYIYTDVLQNIGQSTYESLQATLERRMSAGLSLQSSFTWSKTITDSDSSLPGINGGIQQVQNPDALLQEKALSSQDVPFTFTTALLYELPFGKSKPFLTHGIAGAILGGWQVGAVVRYQEGVPISYGCASGIPGWQNCIRFNRVGTTSPLSNEVLNGTFDPFVNSYFKPACVAVGDAGCAFADPNTLLTSQAPGAPTVRAQRGGAYQLGDYPRNNGDTRSPNYYNEDMSIIRNFRITERASFQLKAELLNVFNRHIFNVPNTFPYDPNFGKVNSTIDAQRIVQFTGRINF